MYSAGASTSSKSAGSKQGKGGGAKKKSGKKSGLDIPDRERSPPSDNLLYDNMCYATTPSSSNDNSDVPFLSSEEDDVAVDIKPVKEKKKAESRAIGNAFKKACGGNTPSASSPTSKLLIEYETHLRNALARGLDAESYSLHTFEALLTQSMENVGMYIRGIKIVFIRTNICFFLNFRKYSHYMVFIWIFFNCKQLP